MFFRVADGARSAPVQGALARNGSRAALKNPALKDFARREQDAEQQVGAMNRLALATRGIRLTTQKANLDSQELGSTHIGMLNRLPDTAEEVRSIAKALRADPARDVFLGSRANEQQVKTMNLADRRIIAFATHALVPGDLDGLSQPALALSAPSVTGKGGDGLLTMEEIMGLRLDADWVVLSACNTASADGKGAEAVSGLGRAFFYAGTRALLVSHWPVETTSARILTTRIFAAQAKEPGLSRAQALRRAMLHLVDQAALTDNPGGRQVVSYAHPMFWAPFTLVGDGGGAGNASL